MAKLKSSLLGTSSLLSTEDTQAVVQRAVEAALAAVLAQQQPQKRPKPAKPLSPASSVKRVAKASAKPAKTYKQSAKHGFRGIPPPLDFALSELRDDQLLTEYECAALTRLSTSTFEAWRKRPDHPLKWIRITGGRVRYRAGDVRQFLASGEPRRPRRKPLPELAPAKPSRRRPAGRPRAKANDLAVDGATR